MNKKLQLESIRSMIKALADIQSREFSMFGEVTNINDYDYCELERQIDDEDSSFSAVIKVLESMLGFKLVDDFMKGETNES